jgi:hypothetical protein
MVLVPTTKTGDPVDGTLREMPPILVAGAPGTIVVPPTTTFVATVGVSAGATGLPGACGS